MLCCVQCQSPCQCSHNSYNLIRCYATLLASLHLVLHSLVSLPCDLRLEVNVDKLALLWRPLAIGIAVVDQLAASCISDFSSGVRERTLGGPLNVVACGFGDDEWLAAAGVAIAVDAFFDRVVEAGALGDSVLCCIMLEVLKSAHLWNWGLTGD